MSGPTKDETLAALARVSRGETWHTKPQPNHWKAIGDLAAERLWQMTEEVT